MTDNQNPKTVKHDPVKTRLLLGEAHMLCLDCVSRLYSFEGFKDQAIPCPHPKKCRDKEELMKSSR